MRWKRRHTETPPFVLELDLTVDDLLEDLRAPWAVEVPEPGPAGA